jgi:hypothetical protein
MPCLAKGFNDVAPDVSCAAGNKISHEILFLGSEVSGTLLTIVTYSLSFGNRA